MNPELLSMDHVWVWTVGPAWVARFAASRGPICEVEELASYFHARNIMYFDSPHSCTLTSYTDALSKLRGFRKVVCSITDEPLKMEDRALELSEASKYHTNVIGGIIDDLSSAYIARNRLSPQELGRIRAALKKKNPSLKLFGVFYTMNFDLNLTEYVRHVDVVSLWVWHNLRDLKNLDNYLEQCPKIFPQKPILLGLYLYNYSASPAPHTSWQDLMPMDLLKFEFNRAAQYLRQKRIIGFQILGSYRRDELKTEEARWIKSFLEENFSVEG